MAKMNKPKQSETIEVQRIEMGEAKFNLLGTSPMIVNRFNQKARQELLCPGESVNAAALEQTLKHDPVTEFRGAFYRNRDPKTPTLFHVPDGAIHGALAQAAVDMPGTARAKMERLTRIVDVNINLYGIPLLFMSMVRNSGMNRAPDVRTRPIFPEWACTFNVRWVKSVVTEKTVTNLLNAAGIIVGIGDWRGEKGGSYGAFELVGDDNPNFKRIVRDQGRKAQQAAYDTPIFYDEDTTELMTWFEGEVTRRERDLPSSPPKTKRGVTITNGRDEIQTG